MIDEIGPGLVVLSPGPGWPSDFGTAALLDAVYGAQACRCSASASACRRWSSTRAARWRCCPSPSTASAGRVRRLGGGVLLDGLPDEFAAARYHSLHAKRPGG